MSKKDKLLQRLSSKPKDFTWGELEGVLGYLEYKQVKTGKTGGSRKRFVHSHYPTIILHKPHPSNILKHYQLDQIVALLKEEKLL